MKQPIYLDHAATTPVDPRVAELMITCLTDPNFQGNPAARSHSYGWTAESVVEQARMEVASLLNSDITEVIFTSGATESNNLALKGAGHRCEHIVSTTIEHKAVLDTLEAIADESDVEVTLVAPNADGVITVQAIQEALRENTGLVSVMHVNNETGAINPISEIGALLKDHKALFHVDGAQSAGKLAVDMEAMGIDLFSLSAHKFYGPKGIGALYVRKGVVLNPLMHGGGHQKGLRSGTLPTHQIAGMGKAASIAQLQGMYDYQEMGQLTRELLRGLSGIEGIHVHGNADNRIAGVLNVGFEGCEGQALLAELHEVAVSSGSACNSASLAPSHVLLAMGVDEDLALSSLRISLGRSTTDAEILQTINAFYRAVAKVRPTADTFKMDLAI